MNTACKQYLRQVRQWLPGTFKRKQAIIACIRQDILQYMEENENPTEAALHQRFGTPQQIAAAYVDEMGATELLKDLRTRRRVVALVAGAVLVVIMIWLAAVGIALWDSFENSRGSITEGEIEEVYRGDLVE